MTDLGTACDVKHSHESIGIFAIAALVATIIGIVGIIVIGITTIIGSAAVIGVAVVIGIAVGRRGHISRDDAGIVCAIVPLPPQALSNATVRAERTNLLFMYSPYIWLKKPRYCIKITAFANIFIFIKNSMICGVIISMFRKNHSYDINSTQFNPLLPPLGKDS